MENHSQFLYHSFLQIVLLINLWFHIRIKQGWGKKSFCPEGMMSLDQYQVILSLFAVVEQARVLPGVLGREGFSSSLAGVRGKILLWSCGILFAPFYPIALLERNLWDFSWFYRSLCSPIQYLCLAIKDSTAVTFIRIMGWWLRFLKRPHFDY